MPGFTPLCDLPIGVYGTWRLASDKENIARALGCHFPEEVVEESGFCLASFLSVAGALLPS